MAFKKKQMRHFIFYTTDGFTQAPDLTEVGNCQILAFEDAFDMQSAWNSFASVCADLSKMGFHNIVCKELKD